MERRDLALHRDIEGPSGLVLEPGFYRCSRSDLAVIPGTGRGGGPRQCSNIFVSGGPRDRTLQHNWWERSTDLGRRRKRTRVPEREPLPHSQWRERERLPWGRRNCGGAE